MYFSSVAFNLNYADYAKLTQHKQYVRTFHFIFFSPHPMHACHAPGAPTFTSEEIHFFAARYGFTAARALSSAAKGKGHHPRTNDTINITTISFVTRRKSPLHAEIIAEPQTRRQLRRVYPSPDSRYCGESLAFCAAQL